MIVEFKTCRSKMKRFETEAPILLIDFDGTITDGHHFNDFNLDIPLAPGCKDVLDQLERVGCTHVLWTCRTGSHLDDAMKYIEKHNLAIHFVNREVPWCTFPNDQRGPKVFGDFYIDDRNIGGLPSWISIKYYVLDHPYYREKLMDGFLNLLKGREDSCKSS